MAGMSGLAMMFKMAGIDPEQIMSFIHAIAENTQRFDQRLARIEKKLGIEEPLPDAKTIRHNDAA